MKKKIYEEVKMEDCPFYYKGYMASVGYSRVENHFYGEVQGIGNVIAFTGKSIDELETNFKEAVDAYLTECEKEGQTPDKQFTGDVLVHLTPDFHCRLALVCEEIGMDIQEFICNTLFASMKGAELSLINKHMMEDMDEEDIGEDIPWFDVGAYNYPLLYKGYGAVMDKNEDTDDGGMLFEGYLLGGNSGDDLYCFNGKTIDEAILNFRRCVDDIIEQNKKDGVEEKPPFNGEMLLKIDPRVQYLLALFANAREMTEDEYVIESLYDSFRYEYAECEVCDSGILEKIISQKEE